MALVLANRVQETGTANTTVSFTLAGAVSGYQSFATIGNTNTTYYSATDAAGQWEVGLGTYSTTGPTLTRTTVYASSNSGSAVTFSGVANIFVTYPSDKSINLDASGNASPLGTVASGTWQGSTVGVAYGGTGVTTSSGANSVVLRDANENITVNRLSQGLQTITASGGTTALTAASDFNQALVGTGGQTFQLPDATTLTDTTTFQFNNNATGTLTITDYASATVGTVAPGGAAGIALLNNATVGGTWDVHGYIPESVTWGTNALALGSTVISGGTWQGGTVQPGYGGTGLTTFTGANNALYSSGSTTLTAGTLPPAAGGTGATATPTNGQLLVGNGVNYSVASLGSGTGISTTTGSGTLTINNTGVTSLAGTSPVAASASTGSVSVSLASGYGDTQNPYGSKTANYVLAAPNGSSGAPTFRAIVAADIPTLNQNTTGSAGSLSGTVAVANGGTGATTLTGYVYGNGTSAMTASTTIPNSGTTATSANTANAIVARNSSGGFSAGAITAVGLSSSGNITATSGANIVSSRPPDDARNTGIKMSDGSDLGELNRSSEYFSDVAANCNGYLPSGNCLSNSTYTPPNGNWWTWGVSGVPTSNCTNNSQYDGAGGNTSTLFAVSVSYNYDAYYVAADEIGGTEYRRNYRNCNCGNCSSYTPSGFNCRTNCNCNCACDCACCGE
jgi:hypothetical protein